MRIVFMLGMTTLLLFGSAHADYSERADVQAYIAELVAEHGFDRDELTQLFSEAERKQSILDAIARPAERRLKWHEYRQIFLKDTRINQGLEFWGKNKAALNAAQETYGVPPEYVVAIIGVETRYGRVTGSYRVVDSLATLGFDYPPRSKFFRSELTQMLLLAREEGVNPRSLTGSYAGAMGYGQFIPSSYRAYSVDFDGDGRRDIWRSPTDAIGSVANYFSRHGWQPGAEVVRQAKSSSDAAREAANKSLNLNHTLGELQAIGVELLDPITANDNGVGGDNALSNDTKAALFRMELEEDAEYWVGLKNFYVITRYNRSRLYALAVHQLSQEIRHRRDQAPASL